MDGHGRLRGDAVVYLASAAIAGGIAVLAGIPLHREWARLAFGPYAAAAVAAASLSFRAHPRFRIRAGLAGLVLAAVLVIPLGLEVAWRARTAPGLHVQSEGIVTEEAARALLEGKDPYEATYLDGPLAARPVGTKTHVPYLPGMLPFGVPRALFGEHAWTDARLWFLTATILALGVAISRTQADIDDRLGALQWTLLAPTGAALAVTGGDDLPVVGLLVLSLVLARERRWVAAGVLSGLAAATKQTAWLVVPFLVVTALREDRRGGARVAIAAAGTAAAIVAPFVAWGPSAFVEDTVAFPLGLGSHRSAAASPTLGRVLVEAFPSARTPITIGLLVAGLGLFVWLVMGTAPADPADGARRAAFAFAAALVLAPAARVGYLVYPVSLVAWSRLVGRLRPAAPGQPVEGGGRPSGGGAVDWGLVDPPDGRVSSPG